MVTVSGELSSYPEMGSYMAVRGFQLNPFERVLFWAALVLGGILVVVRVASMIVLTLLHHHH
jgi:hypothetical protein